MKAVTIWLQSSKIQIYTVSWLCDSRDWFLWSPLQNGDSCIYWAARQGHMEVVSYLREENVSLDTQNRVTTFTDH